MKPITENPTRPMVVLLSGGLDSCVVAAYARTISKERPLVGLSIDYGQKHRAQELEAAISVSQLLRFDEHRVIALPAVGGLLEGASALTTERARVPEGHYADESMKATVVPGRNLMLISLAAALCEARVIAAGRGGDWGEVYIAAHAGDHPIYPDCRPEFLGAAKEAVAASTEARVRLATPFQNKTKAEIVALGDWLDAPMGVTYSCYKGAPIHCGRCGTCVERREAFQLAGVPDPTEYQG